MNNNNDNYSDIAASAIDSSGFDITSKLFIPTQIVNPVMPSILSTPNSALNTSTEIVTKECDMTIDEWFSFIGTPMKDESDNHHDTMLRHAKENNTAALT